jgi:hypothetical protein
MNLPRKVSRRTGRPVVALLDVDGVSYSFDTHIAQVAAQVTGRPLRDFPRAEEWDFFINQWGMTLEEFLAVYRHGVTHLNLCREGMPLPGAVAGWQKLVDHGVAIVIATDCGGPGFEQQARDARLEWLAHWSFHHHHIEFTADKGSVATQLLEEGFDVLAIDDKPKNFEALKTAGAKSFLAHQRWNRDIDDGGNRVLDLDEFADIVVHNLTGGVDN